ncbi:hypothetical protein LTR35_014704 [Friedmanniomyces endolithicus]|uniref:Uncharacterized protein n=1 Tax=Friedmanniomyces endolithicus TaxID=329885 RepID=A0AAN6FCZ4_9PEZI|nr:hypothetical protein LTR35_014704 [Friedmanniomyces endolithicus]KAK0312342.1 hypothetical protein LTR82_013974 [Friedmanniomyces endolithicus]
MYTPSEDKKKHRLSAIFGSRKSREDMDGRPSLSPAPGADGNSVDSAYASSDQPSQHSASTRTSPAFRHANMVSIENNGQISGVDGSRHLQLDQNTGEVMDEDTGEVVTTITTTTTTTTTTVRKGAAAGEKKGTTLQVETRPIHPTVSSQQTPAHTHLAEAPGDGPSARLVPDAPPTHLRARSPVPQALQIGRQQPVAEPAPPLRNPNRKSREYVPAQNGPPSPVTPGAQGRHNFSYPARMGTKSTEHLPQIPPETNQYSPPQVPLREQLSQQQTSPVSSGSGVGSALGNLKAAAIGLHGVGETLRGTLNSEVDNRLSRRDPDKAAAVDAKNRADITRGQQEMARMRERNGLAPTIRRPGELTGSGSGNSGSGIMHPQLQPQQRDSSGSAMQPQRDYAVSPISQHAPQLPPMQVGGGSTGGPSGAAGGSSKWDAPGTWGSARVSEMKAPRQQTNEVHPALRGQGQGLAQPSQPQQYPAQSQPQQQYTPQSQHHQQPPPSYSAPPPPFSSSTNGAGAPPIMGPQHPQRMDDSPRYPGASASGGSSRVPGLVQQGPSATNNTTDSASTGSGLGGAAAGAGAPLKPTVSQNPAANVQHLSQMQGHGGSGVQEHEEERRGGGLKRLFKRKGVGAT